ncbi:MAG TPA: hypothetical protein VF932_12000 [Anaerolineae bacterium]
MSDRKHGPRGRIASTLMVVGAIVLPFLLGLFRGEGENSESEQLKISLAEGHETRDLSIRGILLFGIGLIVMGAITLVVTTALLVLSSRQGGITFRYPPLGLSNVPAPSPPPEPRLETVPGQLLQDLRTNEEQILHSYGWVDQKNGIVRIPIERAIELLSQQGLPSRPAGASPFQDQGTQSPSYPSSGRMQDEYP